MTKRILLIDTGFEADSPLLLQSMKEEYGNDIILVTPQEAKEQGLKPEDFANIPMFPITAPSLISGIQPSGKEKRRKRREMQRKANKKNKP